MNLKYNPTMKTMLEILQIVKIHGPMPRTQIYQKSSNRIIIGTIRVTLAFFIDMGVVGVTGNQYYYIGNSDEI